MGPARLAAVDVRARRHQCIDPIERVVVQRDIGVEHRSVGSQMRTTMMSTRARADVETAIAWARELGTELILIPFFMRAELVGDADVDRAAAAFQEHPPGRRPARCAPLHRGLAAGRSHRCDRGSRRLGGVRAATSTSPTRSPTKGLDPEAEIRALGGLIAAVHIKDTRVTTGDCRPGTGRVDFAGCAQVLAEIGFDGWLTLETPPAPAAARLPGPELHALGVRRS